MIHQLCQAMRPSFTLIRNRMVGAPVPMVTALLKFTAWASTLPSQPPWDWRN